MMKFRKKPVVVEAIQWNDKVSIHDIDKFMDSKLQIDREGDYYIETLEGKMYPQYKDYIIKGIKGEFYPCKPDIFEMTYEKVEE